MVTVEEKDGKRPVAKSPTGRRIKNFSSIPAIKYKELRSKYPNMTIADAKKLAGYHPNSVVPVIPQDVIESIDKEREKAIKAVGYTHTKALKILISNIADNPKAHDSDKIRAIHEANAMLPGYHAPQEVKSECRSLIMEFNQLSSTDLAALKGYVNKEIE